MAEGEETEPKWWRITRLGVNAALWDGESALELSTLISPHALYSLKLSTTAFVVGFLLGSSTKGLSASKQFLAENAHRLPKTKVLTTLMPGMHVISLSREAGSCITGIKSTL